MLFANFVSGKNNRGLSAKNNGGLSAKNNGGLIKFWVESSVVLSNVVLAGSKVMPAGAGPNLWGRSPGGAGGSVGV